MADTDSEKRSAALAFLKAHRTGVLATISPEGVPHARFVYYACDDSFAVSFLTLADTRKVADLTNNNRAAFTIAVEEVPQTLQMEGTVTDMTESDLMTPDGIDSALSELTEKWLSNSTYRAPLTHFDQAVVKYYRLTPTWIRWEDFTAANTSDVVTIIRGS